MDDKDFFGSEKSVTIEGATQVSIEFVGKDGSKKTLKPAFALQDKEIIDASVMNKAALVAFFEKEIASAKE
ncbi:NADP-dependent isocitrate dehydrogenase, partial [Escherichia coli]